ncbi:MAG: hypothetical protein RQ736_11195 [Thiogranum sp.]|nr:hypothetical protein [Thiogranum sp.]
MTDRLALPNCAAFVIFGLWLLQRLRYVLPLVPLLSVSAPAGADTIAHQYQRIYIDYASTMSKKERQLAYVWLQMVSDALLTVYGEWPDDKFNITIKQGSGLQSPVPWGQVTRGKPDHVLLVLDAESGFQEIVSDWTAYHELSHLLIPYRGYGDMWFSEGLATYYQNIIQARAGHLSEAGLWGKLAAGLARGQKQNQWSNIELVEISDHMRKYRSFMRVHWSGVHYWLTADIKLRQLTRNKMTLDRVLKELKDCCQHESMSAASIAERLDSLAGVEIFKLLFAEYRVSRAMPDYRRILTDLGVITDPYGYTDDVALTDDAANADIRVSIYNGDG